MTRVRVECCITAPCSPPFRLASGLDRPLHGSSKVASQQARDPTGRGTRACGNTPGTRAAAPHPRTTTRLDEGLRVTLPREEIDSVTHRRRFVAARPFEGQRLGDVLAGLEH